MYQLKNHNSINKHISSNLRREEILFLKIIDFEVNLMTILQTLISGLLLGGIYSLISMGLNLILGVVRIVNFAHGEFLMIAMYLSFVFYSTMGLDPYVSGILVIACLFILGLITQRFLIQPILDTPDTTKIFVTLGLSIALQNLALMTMGANHMSVRTSYQSSVISIGELAISIPRLISFIVAISVAALLYLFLQKLWLEKQYVPYLCNVKPHT